MKPKIVVIAASLLLAGAAQAQTVWRCGSDGRGYSDSPCPEGRVVAVADTRSADERRVALEVSSRERALASSLAQERHIREREALARNVLPAGIRHEARAEVRPKAAAKKKASSSRRPEAGGTSPAAAPVFPRKTG